MVGTSLMADTAKDEYGNEDNEKREPRFRSLGSQYQPYYQFRRATPLRSQLYSTQKSLSQVLTASTSSRVNSISLYVQLAYSSTWS